VECGWREYMAGAESRAIIGWREGRWAYGKRGCRVTPLECDRLQKETAVD
jgi:hypothetical protein